MHLLNAFAAMTNDLHYGDAPDRQVDAVLDWEDDVRRAVAAVPADVPADCEVTFGGAARCRTWRVSCYAILAALQGQARDADVLRAEADDKAGEQERLAVDADNSAATSDDERTAAAFRAEAAKHREDAEACRDLSRRLMGWQIAAQDAHVGGTRMLADELPRAYQVGEAVVRAGGAREVYGDKRWAVGGRAA